jgi:electron transfer flavoprotein alpha/beta subunit
MTPETRLRVLVPVTGAFHGRLRLRRSSGTLDTEGMERVLSRPSAQAIALAKQLEGAELVAVHVDKGGGEEVLREAMAHGVAQGILIEGAEAQESDASTRAATIADVYRSHGPFDAVVGPARSEFAGFTGALAAVAGHLELPCVVGVSRIEPRDGGFRIQYQSIFGDYDLAIPRPSVVLAGDIAPSHPTAGGIHDAWRVRGILRVQAGQYTVAAALTRRMRIEPVPQETRALESVDAFTLVRRMRSRGLVPGRKDA